MSAPVDSQILAALKTLLRAALPASVGVHTGRSDADPFLPEELPAVNLLPVEEEVSSPSTMGSAAGVAVLRAHRLALVVQVVTRGGSAAEDAARQISAQCDQAIGQDPTLGGVCRQTLIPTGKQWVRDDGSEQRLSRQNTLYRGEYRTYSTDPFTAV